MAAAEEIAKNSAGCQLIYTYHKDMLEDFKPSQQLYQKTFFWEVEHID